MIQLSRFLSDSFKLNKNERKLKFSGKIFLNGMQRDDSCLMKGAAFSEEKTNERKWIFAKENLEEEGKEGSGVGEGAVDYICEVLNGIERAV